MKVEYSIAPCHKPSGRSSSGQAWVPFTTGFPFVNNVNGVLIHRVRSAGMFYSGGKPDRLSVVTLCGNLFASGGTSLIEEVPDGRVVCRRCEIAAEWKKLESASALCGRHVCVGYAKIVRSCGCEPRVIEEGE